MSMEIRLNKPDNRYIAGELLQGSVIIRNVKEEKVRSIYILIQGVADVRWTVEESYRDHNGDTKYRSEVYSSHEQYLNSQTALFGTIEGPTVKLPAGEHTYQFACALPERLPGSMSSHEADIKYSVKLVMDVPWGMDSTKKQHFEVVNVVDLNHNISLRMPVQLEEVKSFCMCSWRAQEAVVSVTVPQGGYVPNEEIPVSCTINNKSNAAFEGVSITLQRIVKAIAVTPQRRERETKDDLAHNENVLVAEETRNRTSNFTGSINVPVCPVSSHYAAYIHTDYVLKVEFSVMGCHSNVTLRLPIEIGTVPLGAQGYAIANAAPLAPMPEPGEGFTGLPSAPPMSGQEEKGPLIGEEQPPPSYDEVTNAEKGSTTVPADVNIGWNLK